MSHYHLRVAAPRPARYTARQIRPWAREARSVTVTNADANEQPGLDVRRRRVVFRCWHRGTKEMDLLLGRYADARIGTMSDDEVDALEFLMDAPDPELFGWIAGTRPVPANYDIPTLHAIRSFHRDNPTSRS
ncbi:succinate dehydrogenase assembly factor 2 [Microbaculum marinum]